VHMPTSNSRIGPYELNAPGYNPANLEGDIWTDYTSSVAGDQNRNLGVQFPERPYPKMRKVEPKLDMAYREDEQMYRRLDALNAENLRLEQENKLFKKTNVGLKELIPQLPYASIPPAQLALPQFWDDRAGHPVPPGAIGSSAFADPVPMFAPGLTDHPKKSFDLTARPGPLDVHVAEVLDEKHQAYLHQRQQIIDDREAEYQVLQTKLAGLSEEAVLEPEPVKQPEEVLYAERNHSRVPFGKWEAGGRLYAKQWQLRPERTARGHKYLGEWMGGEEHGRGLYTFQDGKYVGQWEHGRPHGHGVFIYANRDTYEGDWKENREGTHGAKNGKGTYLWANGNEYKGEWRNDKRHGQGVYKTSAGAKYEGEWNNGRQQGHGIVDFPNGSRYVGQWAADLEDGEGMLICRERNECYKGQWKAGFKHGKGELHFADGTCYHGSWAEGEDTNEGTYKNSDGSALGSKLAREEMQPQHEIKWQSSRNQDYGVDFPFHFSLVKSTGDYGGAAPCHGRRGVPTTSR